MRHAGGLWVRTLTTLTVVLGLGVSVVMGSLLTREQHRTGEHEFSRRVDLVTTAVGAQNARYVDAVRTVGAATGAFTTLTPAKYAQVTAPLRGMHLAGATSIAFLVPAGDRQIPAVQAFWRSRGVPGLVLRPAGTGQEHLFTIYASAVGAGEVAPRPGVDAAQAPVLSEALTRARVSGQVTVSDTYQLIVDKQLPAARRQLSFVLISPVYEPPDGRGRRQFQGWVSMGIRGQDYMDLTLQGISQHLLDVTLRAQNADHRMVTVAALRMPSSAGRDLRQAVGVDIADRRWQVDIAAHNGSLPGSGGDLPDTVIGGGALLAFLLGAFVYLLATGRDRAEAKVLAATAELREQKTLLEAIMDSVGEGVVVIDERGEFILTNPAAAPYLRVDDKTMTNSRWGETVQLFRPDGVTPFPVGELPTIRALAGESSNGVELIRRSAGSPEVVFSASARPLDGRAGRRGAVGVFHDITTRKHGEDEMVRTAARLASELAIREATENELRGREAELTSFAGMVAHDLKAPLRAMGGFTRILGEDLANASGEDLDPALRRSMDRIVSAVQRMNQLIDDLLAFATARDRRLSPQPIDLRILVADVISECTAHLEADDPPVPIPVFEVELLPCVQADPGMCRQLLDNLIGNALKFTQPGQTAHIQISAHPEPEHWIRIEIADRGIGIPPGKHEDVFVTFQRAHPGYTGTGLGLAICQRIVERHGGTIGARDNTDGGTRFHFTLPTTQARQPTAP